MLLFPHQRNINQSGARFKVIKGGRRGGKTKFETEVMTFKGAESNNHNVVYLAPTQKQARDIIWESLKERLQGIGRPNESRLEMKIPTQEGGWSTIFVGGWENRENRRGMPHVHHLVFDEIDSMKDFFVAWQEIFRPMMLDTGGTGDFIGTPKKENPNLRRLEKIAETDPEWESFHFTSWDNPAIKRSELELMKTDLDADVYRQEILAEYVDSSGSLFKYAALTDLFSNTITKGLEKYLIVDIADDGSDKTMFSFWEDLENYRVEQFEHLNTEGIIDKIREYAAAEQIPHSQIAVDAIGVGAGVASSSLLAGIIGYKGSYQAIKVEESITLLPNVHYRNDAIPLISDYRNLRSQCIFKLAELINAHKVASRITDIRAKERIFEELSLYQDVSPGDGKKAATSKEAIKINLGRSPDLSDTFIMRMYFVLKEIMIPQKSEARAKVGRELRESFDKTANKQVMNSTK